MSFPTVTKLHHSTAYPSISPLRPELSVAGKVVLITGGGGGLGSSLASSFATAGATKIALLGRTLSTISATKSLLEAAHPHITVLALVADITDELAVNKALAQTKAKLGPVDILVANAGYLSHLAPVATAPLDEWKKGYEINVLGNLILVQAFLANKSEAGSVIVNITTAGVHIPAIPTMSSYAVSKLASVKLFDFVAAENPDVRVLNVHPGIMDTDIAAKAAQGGLVMPFDDVSLPANFVVWAVSDEAKFLGGKLVWAHWDVDELIARKAEFEGTPKFTIGLLGWP